MKTLIRFFASAALLFGWVGLASAADCNVLAQDAAAVRNAQLISAVVIEEADGAVCEIVLLTPSASGPRKRETLVLPVE